MGIAKLKNGLPSGNSDFPSAGEEIKAGNEELE